MIASPPSPADRFASTEPSEAPAYVPSPTATDFILATREGSQDEMRVLILMGSRGVGKTTAAIYACLALAERLAHEGKRRALPVRVAVIRDTWVSIMRSTIESFKEAAAKGLRVEFRNSFREAVVGDEAEPLAHFSFVGVDTIGDVDKLQGFSFGVLWAEEVAPAAGLTSGIPQEVFGVGATSIRQVGVPPRVLVTMNPPDDDAWIIHVEEHLAGLGLEKVRVARFTIPSKEKAEHFRVMAARSQGLESEAWIQAARDFEAYQKRNRAFLESIGRTDLVARLVEGRTGEIMVGEPVVPAFVRAKHVAKEALPTSPSLPLFLLFDGGGSPSCVLFKDLPNHGGINVLGSHTLENSSMEALIRDWVLPFLQRYNLMPTRLRGDAYGGVRKPGHELRVIGDPSLQWEGSTVRADNASGTVIESMLGAGLEPGPVEWSARREALHMAFSRAGRGERPAFVQIDPDENELLIKALSGRFRYPKNMASGRVIYRIEAAKKESGPLFSGTPDALAYGLAVLYPAYEWLKSHQRQRVPTVTIQPPKSFLGI